MENEHFEPETHLFVRENHLNQTFSSGSEMLIFRGVFVETTNLFQRNKGRNSWELWPTNVIMKPNPKNPDPSLE